MTELEEQLYKLSKLKEHHSKDEEGEVTISNKLRNLILNYYETH